MNRVPIIRLPALLIFVLCVSSGLAAQETAEEESGFALEFNYTAEYLHNTRGGIKTGGYTGGLVDLGLSYTAHWDGFFETATFTVIAQNGHALGITTDYVGDIQAVSNIEAPYFTQVSEYWWHQTMAGGKFAFKLGKQDFNADFCALDQSGEFIHSSFGFVPTIPLPSFPHPAMGLSLYWMPADSFQLKAGVADSDAHGGHWGLSTAFDGHGGLFCIVEPSVHLNLGTGGPGTYRVGYWKDTGDWEEVSQGPDPETLNGAEGYYIVIDQTLWLEDTGDPEGRGLHLVAQYGNSPEERIEISRYWGLGLVLRNLLGEWENALGIGVARAGLSPGMDPEGRRQHETAYELFYRVQVTDWLALQPEVQYITNPGGVEGLKDAFVVGLRIALSYSR